MAYRGPPLALLPHAPENLHLSVYMPLHMYMLVNMQHINNMYMYMCMFMCMHVSIWMFVCAYMDMHRTEGWLAVTQHARPRQRSV